MFPLVILAYILAGSFTEGKKSYNFLRFFQVDDTLQSHSHFKKLSVSNSYLVTFDIS